MAAIAIATVLHPFYPKSSPPPNRPIRVSLPLLRSQICRCTANDEAPPPAAAAEEAVRIRYRGVSKGRKKKQKMESEATVSEQAAGPSKAWEEMSTREKAIELYVGEKGLLFWLNKFAYASIYIIIGAWILFRFVGPALNLYQLDGPPLTPTSLLKGS